MKILILIFSLYLTSEDDKDSVDEFKEDEDKYAKKLINGKKNEGKMPSCNREILISYGLDGYSEAKIQGHQFCPAINENCCKQQDEITSYELWEREYGPKIEKYYDMYLYLIKYLLGFTSEGYLLALDFKPSKEKRCYQAAYDYEAMNLNPKVTMEMYDTFSKSVSEIAKIRKGFYCTICDAQTQSKLNDFWKSNNRMFNKKLYYSKDFCEDLVQKNIKTSYLMTFTLKRYLENLIELISCQTQKTQIVEYEIPYEIRQKIKHCFFFKNKYFFFFCEKYCELFSLTKSNEIIDGNLIQLKKFFDIISENRKKAFHKGDLNILMDGLEFEENYIKDFVEEAIEEVIFIKPVKTVSMLEEYESDVVFFGGFNPFDSIPGSKYPLHIQSVKRLMGVLLLFLFWIWN